MRMEAFILFKVDFFPSTEQYVKYFRYQFTDTTWLISNSGNISNERMMSNLHILAQKFSSPFHTKYNGLSLATDKHFVSYRKVYLLLSTHLCVSSAPPENICVKWSTLAYTFAPTSRHQEYLCKLIVFLLMLLMF